MELEKEFNNLIETKLSITNNGLTAVNAKIAHLDRQTSKLEADNEIIRSEFLEMFDRELQGHT